MSRFTKKNREKKALIKLDGTAITQSGHLTKTNYFNFLQKDLDDYDQIEMTPEQAKKVHNHLQKLSTGTSAMVPIHCGGADLCPYADRCVFVEIGSPPVGKQCITENQILKEYTMRYLLEFDVDPNNWTEVGYVNELASLDILDMRLNMCIARPENAELVIDQVTNISHDGTPILQKQISPFMEQKEKISNRKSKIIKLMVGDRQEKYKKESALKIKLESDPSSKMSQMKSRLENLQRTMDNLQREAEGDVLTPQDIIDSIDEE